MVDKETVFKDLMKKTEGKDKVLVAEELMKAILEKVKKEKGGK